jgi:acetolactate synthase-1/2/3 large subunit
VPTTSTDNRQRSSNVKPFAPEAKLLVIDIDSEELDKFQANKYDTICMDIRLLPSILDNGPIIEQKNEWKEYVKLLKERYFDKCFSSYAKEKETQSPYEVIKIINTYIDDNAIVVNDTGAALCWFYQTFKRTNQTVFTAGGNSPMGYALPASIGASISSPDHQVICFSGDGGFQLNIQELATLKHHDLNVVVIILNNGGYGIIKQFQDANFQGRYFATNDGYSLPDFKGIIEAYGLKYYRIETPDNIKPEMFNVKGGVILDVIIDPNTTVEPKVETHRLINDQYPYVDNQEFEEGNAFFKYTRQV